MENSRLTKDDVFDFISQHKKRRFTVNELFRELMRAYPFKMMHYKLIEGFLDILVEEKTVNRDKRGFATLIWMEDSDEG